MSNSEYAKNIETRLFINGEVSRLQSQGLANLRIFSSSSSLPMAQRLRSKTQQLMKPLQKVSSPTLPNRYRSLKGLLFAPDTG